MTESTITSHQPVTISAILNRVRAGQRSIVDHDIAIRRPLAELVETTITASCNSSHTARNYRRGIGEFITLLSREHFDGAPLVERFQHGKHKATVFDYGDTPAAVLLLVDNTILDKFNQERKQAAYAVKTLLAVAYRDNIITQTQAVSMGIKPYKSKTRRNEKPAGRRLSALEVQSLRASVDTSTNGGKRDLAMLDMMLFAGLRRQEVAELSLSDFHQDGGRWVIVLTGKGGKVRKVAVHKALFASLSLNGSRSTVASLATVRRCSPGYARVARSFPAASALRLSVIW
jgi:site-specific recombinase XerD